MDEKKEKNSVTHPARRTQGNAGKNGRYQRGGKSNSDIKANGRRNSKENAATSATAVKNSEKASEETGGIGSDKNRKRYPSKNTSSNNGRGSHSASESAPRHSNTGDGSDLFENDVSYFADISISDKAHTTLSGDSEKDDYVLPKDAFCISEYDILPECILPSNTTANESSASSQTIGGKTEVVGVCFEKSEKIYYFAPGADKFSRGDHAIVETARGIEYCEIGMGNTFVDNNTIIQPLRAICRRATDEDTKRNAENRCKEKEALNICEEKIRSHGLDMKLVDVRYTFDNSKLIFYFTAAGRVDFRELVKDLAAVFRTRIELRQIGIRDEAKFLGGCGVCGRRLCCAGFLPNFAQVSIRMAKEQGLSLNSSKISGCCGRLMCCLRFEQDTYEYELALTPSVESVVETPDGKGVVTECNPLAGTVKVKLDSKENDPPQIYHRDALKVISRARKPFESRSFDGDDKDTPAEE